MTDLLMPQTGELPHAIPGRVTAPFWSACAQGQLTFQRCTACRTIAFPPSEHCRNCLSLDLSWEVSGGRAQLYSWTVVWRAVTPAFTTPYAPAIVDVEEGYQMMTNLIGVAPDRIATGMPLKVAFHRSGPALTLPYFEPV